MVTLTISSLYDAFRKTSSSLLEEGSFIFLHDVDVSPPFLLSNIEDTYASLFFKHEVPSFDVESSENRSTTKYVLSKDSFGVVS